MVELFTQEAFAMTLNKTKQNNTKTHNPPQKKNRKQKHCPQHPPQQQKILNKLHSADSHDEENENRNPFHSQGTYHLTVGCQLAILTPVGLFVLFGKTTDLQRSLKQTKLLVV